MTATPSHSGTQIDPTTSVAWLDDARIVAIFGVVLIHTSAKVLLESDVGDSQWWAANVYDALARWSVPVFVMVSGALLLPQGSFASA